MSDTVNRELHGAAPLGASAATAHDEVIVDVSDPHRIRITRPRDMLYFHVRYENFVLDGSATVPTLARAPATPAKLIFEFPSQHLAERPYRDTEPPTLPVRCLSAGPSWLVFRVPATKPEFDRIPLANLGTLLFWNMFSLVLPAAGVAVAAPIGSETALEIPYHLFLAPIESANPKSGWAHSIEPEIRQERAQLWMTRYVARDQKGQVRLDGQHLRAFFQNPTEPPGFEAPGDPPGQHLVMSANFRQQIVELTSDAHSRNDLAGLVQFQELALSARGASMRVRGEWNNPRNGLSKWQQTTTSGRDHFVRLVTKGFLVPSGHPAVWIELTERYFKHTDQGEVAVLIKKEFAVPTRKQVSYRGHARPYSGRTMPLASIDVLTESSPPLEMEVTANAKAWWCRLEGTAERFNFLMSGVDDAGHEVRFDLPMLFVVDDVDVTASLASAALSFRAEPATVRTRNTGMRTIQFVTGAEGGDLPDEGSSLDAKALSFSTLLPTEMANDDWPGAAPPPAAAPYYLHVDAASIRLPSAAHLTGTNDLAEFAYFDVYKKSGLGPPARGGVYENIGHVFGTLARGPAIKFSKDPLSSGGIATPDITPTAISRKYGAVIGDPGTFGKGTFDPAQFGASAKLFGVVPMDALIQKGNLDPHSPADPARPSSRAPKLGTRVNPDGSLVSTIEYTTFALASWPAASPIFKAKQRASPRDENKDTDTWLHLKVEVVTGRPGPGGSPPDVQGEIYNFSLVLSNIVQVDFNNVKFSAGSGGFNLNPSIKDVTFLGNLAAIQKLAEKIVGSSKNSLVAPRIELLDDAIFAGLKLRLPDIPVGAFSFSHLNLFGGIVLSLKNTPVRFRWAFASPQLPFLVTVGIFGGGGFFSISLGPDGLEDLAICFEFGGAFKLSLGVAQGEAHLLGGVYYGYDAHKDSTFRAYVRAGGSLSVLDIITMSTEFYLGLEYRGGVLTGTCKLTVTIEVFFFSASVDLVMQKTFDTGGSKLLAAPAEARTLAELMTSQQWGDYWDAFAS